MPRVRQMPGAPTGEPLMSSPTSVAVRRADRRDLPALDHLNQVVQGLHAEALPAMFKPPVPGGTSAFFAEALQRDRVVVFVAELGELIVGYLFAEETHRPEGAFTHPTHVLHVHHIAVDDAHRRSGAGRALLAAADDWARTQGLTDLALEHWAFNDEASRFFIGLGFEVDAVRMSRPVSGPGRARFGRS